MWFSVQRLRRRRNFLLDVQATWGRSVSQPPDMWELAAATNAQSQEPFPPATLRMLAFHVGQVPCSLLS